MTTSNLYLKSCLTVLLLVSLAACEGGSRSDSSAGLPSETKAPPPHGSVSVSENEYHRFFLEPVSISASSSTSETHRLEVDTTMAESSESAQFTLLLDGIVGIRE